MTGMYAPYLFTGGGQWFKHHLLLVDEAGNLASIQPFQGETERTIAHSGILFPAFPPTVATTPEAALTWFTHALTEEAGTTVKTMLERLFPGNVIQTGQPVALWNLQDVYPEDRSMGSTVVLKPLYP